jgi:hypothetical protein
MKIKLLPLFFIAFILLQSFFTYKGVETFPFLNYGMYSAPINRPDSIQILSLQVNGKEYTLTQLPYLSKPFLEYNLAYDQAWVGRDYQSTVEKTIRSRFEGRLSNEAMQRWIQQLCNAPEQEKVFGNWLAKYLQPSFIAPIKSIDLKIEQYQYHSQSPYKLLNTHVRPLYPPR